MDHSEKANAQTGRTKVACHECRKNKRKCDGRAPVCGLCERNGRTCVYASETQKRKRKRQDEEYIRTLEEEIVALKSLLDLERSKSDLSATKPATTAYSQTSEYEDVELDGSIRREVPDINTDAMSAEAIDELGSLMLNLGIEDEGEPSFTLASGKNQSIDRRNSVTMAASSPNLNSTSPPPALSNSSMLQHLLDCFLQHFNPRHLVLGASDIAMFTTDDYWNKSPDVQFRDCTIYTVGAQFSDRLNAISLEEELADFAQRIVGNCLKNKSSIFVIQGLSILAWRELMAGNNSMAYNYNSWATGLSLHLGLHVTALSRAQSTSEPEKLLIYARRVRTFWSYFSVDRMITAVVGMNCTMPWQRVRVAPFLSILDGKETIDEIAFDRQGQLWHLWDSLMDQVLAFNWRDLSSDEKQKLLIRARQALFSLLRDSDERLQAGDENLTTGVICFRLSFQTALLLIHRPFICETDLGPLKQLAIRSASAAANSITLLVKNFQNVAKFPHIPPEVINHVSCAAVIHLLNATSGKGTIGRRASNRLATCLDILTATRARWNFRASASIRFIQELAHRWKVVWALPLSMSYPLNTTMLPSTGIGENTMSANNGNTSVASDSIMPDLPIQILDQYCSDIHDETLDSMALNWLFGATDEDLSTCWP